MLEVVGTIFIKDRKILLDKPRKRPTHQMVGGKIEAGETPSDAAYRECVEELGTTNLDKSLFEFVMSFEEKTTSDPNVMMRFYLFKYNGELKDTPVTSEEIASFLWYDTTLGDGVLSYALKETIIPYCVNNNLID